MRRFALICLVAATALGAPVGPAAAKTYTVPGSIESNCSVAVESKVMAWLATVPDGSTVQFAANGCYGQDGTIALTGRKGLVLDGRGAEFRALTRGGSHRANWRFVGGSNLTVKNMAVRGSNPQGGYDPSVEWQHGYSVEGVQGMKLSKVQAHQTWGDGIDLWRGANSPACGDDASSARNVVIDGATLYRNGRQGLAVVDAETVTLKNSTVGPVAWSSVDLETDDDCEIARHITIDHNSFGANHYGVIASVGFGGDPQLGDVTVSDNTQTAPTGLPEPGNVNECWAPVRILSPDSLYRNAYTFRRNHFLARRNGFEFRRLRNVTVDSNIVDYDTTFGCGTRAGVLMVDSHTVGITNNHFNGADWVFTADSASDHITARNNTSAAATAPTATPVAPSAPPQTNNPTAAPPTGGSHDPPSTDGPAAPSSGAGQNRSPGQSTATSPANGSSGTGQSTPRGPRP